MSVPHSETIYAEKLSFILEKKIDFPVYVCSLAEQIEKIANELPIENIAFRRKIHWKSTDQYSQKSDLSYAGKRKYGRKADDL